MVEKCPHINYKHVCMYVCNLPCIKLIICFMDFFSFSVKFSREKNLNSSTLLNDPQQP